LPSFCCRSISGSSSFSEPAAPWTLPGRSLAVPAGSYKDCVKIREELSDGSTDYKLYALSVGSVKEIESDGAVSLKSHTTIESAP
jgi:hypothetical protein